MNNADLFYGTFWRIDKDDYDDAESFLRDALEGDDEADFHDLADTLTEKYSGKVTYHDDHRTIWFGITITSLNESENKFDEMALLRVMDLDKGVLRQDEKDRMRKIMDEIPYKLREKLSNPKFGVAWSTA